jgi:hypothetical protein
VAKNQIAVEQVIKFSGIRTKHRAIRQYCLLASAAGAGGTVLYGIDHVTFVGGVCVTAGAALLAISFRIAYREDHRP